MPTQEDIKNRLSSLRERVNPNAPKEERPVETLKISRVKHVEVTVADLKAAINSNPDHVKALHYKKGIRGLTDDRTVTVEQQDLLALLDNKDIRVNRSVSEIEGDLYGVYEKEVVDKEPDPSDSQTPRSPSATPSNNPSGSNTPSEASRNPPDIATSSASASAAPASTTGQKIQTKPGSEKNP